MEQHAVEKLMGENPARDVRQAEPARVFSESIVSGADTRNVPVPAVAAGAAKDAPGGSLAGLGAALQKASDVIGRAEELARAGAFVFPCGEDKKPLCKSWKAEATNDPAKARGLFIRAGDKAQLIGLACGPSGLVVIDADAPRAAHKHDGVKNFSGFIEKTHAETGVNILEGVPVVRTQSGGLHFYYAQPEGGAYGNSTGSLPEGVDVRGDGGYVIAPGGSTARGEYKQAGGPDLLKAFAKKFLPALPDALREALRPKARASSQATKPKRMSQGMLTKRLAQIPNDGEPGKGGFYESRDRWAEMGFAIYGASGGEPWGRDLWLEWCDQTPQNPGEPERFWDTIDPAAVRSGAGYIKQQLERLNLTDARAEVSQDEAKTVFEPVSAAETTETGGASKSRPQQKPAVELLRADSVKPRAIEWLWKGYLARGKLHLLAGASTAGKTTLALKLAAVVTTGGKWPDGASPQAPGNVLIWSGEDDPQDVLIPRLMAAGARLSRVFFVSGLAENGGKRRFDPSKDMPVLASELSRIGGASLMILDSIVSAVGGDSHKNNEVRRGLQPVVDLAETHGIATLGIVHFSKGTQGRVSRERINGSVAFGALSRVNLYCAAEEDPAGVVKRTFIRGDSNISKSGGGWEYDLEVVSVPVADGGAVETTRVVFGSGVAGSAEAILAQAEGAQVPARGRPRGTVEATKALLRDMLADGPVSRDEIEDRAVNGEGLSWRTVERAKTELGIVARKERGALNSGWVWELPSARGVFEPAEGSDDVF